MAIRLSMAFGSTPETWAGMQLAYDLVRARKNAGQLDIKRVAAPAPEAAE
jgi:plasmid maintenance system antidote protein VapI